MDNFRSNRFYTTYYLIFLNRESRVQCFGQDDGKWYDLGRLRAGLFGLRVGLLNSDSEFSDSEDSESDSLDSERLRMGSEATPTDFSDVSELL